MATLAPCYNATRVPSQALSWDGPKPSARAIEGEAADAVATPALRLSSRHFWRVLFFTMKVFHGALSWGLLGIAGLFGGLFLLQFPHSPGWDTTWWVMRMRAVGDPTVVQVLIWIKPHWPTFRIAGYLPLALAFAAVLLKLGLGAALMPVLGCLRQRMALIDPLPVPVAVGGREEGARVDSEKAREHLLKRYREIESALQDSVRKRCAFLSIDVVGSTEMKESERELPVAITFQAYMNMLEEVFARHGAWKAAWTPDGVMVCFLELDRAVAAAQEVLRQLRRFNRTENLLRRRLSVRCGLNEDEVPIFEDSKLEKIAHRAIDICGHMQKHAKPDTLWLSAEVYKKLKERGGFRPAGKIVDGLPAYEWSPSLALPDQPLAVLPIPGKKAGNSDPTWA